MGNINLSEAEIYASDRFGSPIGRDGNRHQNSVENTPFLSRIALSFPSHMAIHCSWLSHFINRFSKSWIVLGGFY
jgi:hypothetical protein